MEDFSGTMIVFQELLENILSHLSTAQLLQVRLTSQIFRSVASQLLRKRQILVQPPDNSNESIHDTFLDVANLPWSACKFSLPSGGFELGGLNDLPKCLQTFGPHIRGIYVDMSTPCYGELAQIIVGLPLLESLSIQDSSYLRDEESSNYDFSAGVTSDGRKKAPRLKKFAARIHTEPSFKFLKWILLASNSKMMGVSVDAKYAEIGMQLLISIASVFLSMNLDMNGFRKVVAIPKGNLQNINQLHLHLSIDAWSQDQVFEYLGNAQVFINRMAPNLERFSIGFRGIANGPMQIELQKMPKLKWLQFTSCHDQDSSKPPLYILKPFTSDHFPNLHKVVLSKYYKNYMNINLFRDCTFDTVRELVVFKACSNPMVDDWATVFPNLESLFTAVNPGCLEYILQRMTGLVNLRLRINEPQFSIDKSQDVNVILSGVSDVDNFYKEPKLISHASAARRPYSLHSLTNLKRLELCFPRIRIGDESAVIDRLRRFRLRDSGAYFSLLELKPLDYLCLGHVNISDALNKGLSERHGVYEQIENDIYRRKFQYSDRVWNDFEIL